MNVIGSNHKLADLVSKNNELLPVISRFNIKLGFGDPTIDDICRERGVNKKFFLLIVNTFLNKDYFPEDELRTISPGSILSYLRETHRYYLDYILPRIDDLFAMLTSRCKGDCTSLSVIISFYNKYKAELLLHIRDEEDRVFPYAEELIASKNNQGPGFRIDSFEKEHTNVEDKISDLKNILIKHLDASYDTNICNEFIYALSQFEKDLKDHARIEDKILVPLIKNIEKEHHPKRKPLISSVPSTSKNEQSPEMKSQERSEELSAREKDVLKHVALGHSNKEIADKLFISTHTVISHRKNITRKLGIRSISGLTVYSILNKIIDTDTLDPATLI